MASSIPSSYNPNALVFLLSYVSYCPTASLLPTVQLPPSPACLSFPLVCLWAHAPCSRLLLDWPQQLSFFSLLVLSISSRALGAGHV